MNRRSLLIGLGAALAAPAIVRAGNLMKLWVPPAPKIIATLDDFEEGIMWHYTQPVGRYTRVGNMVSFAYELKFIPERGSGTVTFDTFGKLLHSISKTA